MTHDSKAQNTQVLVPLPWHSAKRGRRKTARDKLALLAILPEALVAIEDNA